LVRGKKNHRAACKAQGEGDTNRTAGKSREASRKRQKKRSPRRSKKKIRTLKRINRNSKTLLKAMGQPVKRKTTTGDQLVQNAGMARRKVRRKGREPRKRKITWGRKHKIPTHLKEKNLLTLGQRTAGCAGGWKCGMEFYTSLESKVTTRC